MNSLKNIRNSIRMLRWHLGHTIPMIMRHSSTYPEKLRKSTIRRYWENLYIYLRDGAPCVAYDGFGLDIKGQKLSDFVSDYVWISFLCKRLAQGRMSDNPFQQSILEGNTLVPLLQNKYLFWSYLNRHGFPVVPVLAHTVHGEIYEFSNRSLDSLTCFFVKATDELCGTGVYSVKLIGGKLFAGEQEIDIKELAKTHDYIIQPVIENHADIKMFNPTTLNTIRVVTCITPNGNIELWDLGMLRIGRTNGNVDNFAKGGIGVGIDETGKLKKYGYSHDKQYFYQKMDRHPDSQLIFEGHIIPFYKKTIELVIKAHSLFPNIQTIGWDVAITPNGPLLLEGNHNWDMEMLQIVHQKGAAPRFREIYRK